MNAFKNLNGRLIAKRGYPYTQGFENNPGNVEINGFFGGSMFLA